MKIYLSCAIRGGRELQTNYQAINDYLSNNGHTILTHHVASPNVLEIEESMSDDDIFTQDIMWLQECDVVVAEVSIPSLGVGYEIAYAIGLNKPVLGVYEENQEKKLSAMISGNTSPCLTLRSYQSIPQLLWHLRNFFSTLPDFD